MDHSPEAKRNLTEQLEAQLGFYLRDLVNERKSLAKAKSYARWPNPGIKSMIAQHQRGVRKTLTDIERMKIRINRRYRNGEIYKISF